VACHRNSPTQYLYYTARMLFFRYVSANPVLLHAKMSRDHELPFALARRPSCPKPPRTYTAHEDRRMHIRKKSTR
jgi:hypothetical protein